MSILSKTVITHTTLCGLATFLSLDVYAAEEMKTTSLPLIEKAQMSHPEISSESFRLANEIYQVMKPYLLDSDIDACAVGLSCQKTGISDENSQKLIIRLAKIIQNKQPIELNLLGFPFKSGNKDSNVLGHQADMAEYKSLEYLNSMMIKMKALYKNCHLTIHTDGLLFNDLFEIPDQAVIDYEGSLKKLAKDFPDIKFLTFTNMLNKHGDKLQDLRDASDSQAIPDDSSGKLMPPELKLLIKKRIYNEINHSGHSFSRMSPQEKERTLDRLAALVVGRVHTAGTYIKPFESKVSIHLSVHPQKDFAKKLGIKLFDSSVVTPPNGVLVQEKNGMCHIRYKHQVDLKNYQLDSVSINGISCPFYIWR